MRLTAIKFQAITAKPAPPYRILLLGADKFSCATLRALHEAGPNLIEQILIVTPPNTRTGRNLTTIHRPPLKLLGKELKIPTISLTKDIFKYWTPPAPFDAPSSSNILVAASFGYLIPNRILDMFEPLNTLNVHPSLLPIYRGAAPIQWALINGDIESGVTVQALSRNKFDQGKLLGQAKAVVSEVEDFKSLESSLSRLGADLLVRILSDLSSSQEKSISQDSSLATLAPKLTKDSARVFWQDMDSSHIDRLRRGVSHQYSLWTTLEINEIATNVQLVSLAKHSGSEEEAEGGVIWYDSQSKALLVSCGSNGSVMRILRMKIAGKAECAAGEWWQGTGKKLNEEYERKYGKRLRFV